MKINFVEKLLDYKKKHKLSFAKLAEETGISVTTLQRIKRETRQGIHTNRQSLKILAFLNKYDIDDHRMFSTHRAAILYYRKMLGLSQYKLAMMSGHADRSTLSELENGRGCKHSYSTIKTLESLLNRQIYIRKYKNVKTKADVLNNILEKKIMTKVELAKKAGLCFQTIFNFANKNIATKPIIKRVSETLKIKEDVFYDTYLAKKYFTQKIITDP